MADAYTLLEQYIAEHRSGGRADPLDWVERVHGADRAKLAALIDAYLERTPMRGWDPSGFRDSGLAPFAERVNDSLYSDAGNWPAVLPALRDRARVRRSELTSKLAAALGAAGQEHKVASYYHQMERGLLPAAGVNDRVLDALGTILGQSAEALRRAGEAVTGAGPARGEAVFARRTHADPSDEPAAGGPPASEPASEWDEVDRLFRGG